MKDILLDGDYDLAVEGGDVQTNEASDEQTLALLMETVPGEWKWSPEDGVGLVRWGGAPEGEMQGLLQHVQECMKRNGIRWETMGVREGVLSVEL